MSQTVKPEEQKLTLHEQVAANLRAEMAAQRFTAVDLAGVLHIGYRSATNRWNGTQPIALNELHTIAQWLGVSVSSLMASRVRMEAVA